jgi:uncharacterized protein (DUF885 family)
MQGYADLGVNVLGWSFDDLADVLADFNIYDRELVRRMFNAVTGVPITSVMYSLGFMELMELLEHAENELGRNFELIDFHRFFLEFGPAPFSIIRERMDAS